MRTHFIQLQKRLLPKNIGLISAALAGTAFVLFFLLPQLVFGQEGADPIDSGMVFLHKVILNLLWVIVVNVFGTWVTIGGSVLNTGLGMFVIGFGNQFLYTGIGFQIDTMWRLIRDLFNLTFIFGLVYLGIRMILNSDDSNTKRNLVFLILAALLVNFSLFFTKFIVDFTNVTAVQIASNLTVSTTEIQVIGEGGGLVSMQTPDVAGTIKGHLQLTSFLGGGAGTPDFENLVRNAGSGGAYAYVIFTGIFLLITGFVLIGGGLLLIIRFVVLNFYLIFSPLIFLGWVFPNLQGITSKYWKGFLGRAFFAPVYVLCLFIALKIMDGYVGVEAFSRGDATGVLGISTTLADFSTSFLKVIVPFVIVSGFMLGALIIAQKLGADGANLTMSIGNNLQKRGRRAVLNTAANTVGRFGRAGSEIAGTRVRRGLNRLQSLEAPTTGGGLKGWTARRAQNTARRNFVERGIGGAASAMQNAKFGMSTTVSQDQAFKSATERAADSRAAISQGHRAMNSDEERLYQQILKRQKELDEIRKAGGDDMVVLADGVTEKKRSDITSDEQAQLDTVLGDMAEKRQAIIAKMQSKINDLSIKDIEAMSQTDREAIAGLLTSGQIESVMKSDNINAGDKSKIAISRSNTFRSTVEEVLGDQRVMVTDRLQKLSAAQLEAIGLDFINQNAADLTDKQIDDLSKSKNFTENQINQLKANRERGIIKKFNDTAVTRPIPAGSFGPAAPVNRAFYETTSATRNPSTGQLEGDYTKKKKAEEIAKMPAAVLTDDKAIPYITSDVLNEIVKNKKLTIDERAGLADKVINKVSDRLAAVGGDVDKLDKQDKQLYRMLINNPSQKMKDEFNL